MKINILHYIEGSKNARGLTVIIDVFRAFSVACYAIHNGANQIIPVDTTDNAFRLKKKNPEYLLMGERHEKIVPGFDYGNSPTHIEHIDFTGKTIIQTTSAGTRGLVNAISADEIITGSFVNAPAIIHFIQSQDPEFVSLVAMGYAGTQPADEDTFCARYIKNTLEGKPTNLAEMITILKAGSGKRFFDPENVNHSPPRDFDLCLQLGIFDFVLKAEALGKNLVSLKKLVYCFK